MKIINIYEEKKSTNGIIELSHTYIPNSIKLLCNSVYYEISENKIQIENGVDNVYHIVYNHECKKNKEIISDNPNKDSFYKTYGDKNTLYSNNVYTAYLNLDGVEYNNVFTSKIEPLYSSVEKIKNDIGSVIDDIGDIEILKKIYYNSKSALYLYTRSEEEDIDLDEIEVTFAIKEYVRYKTDLDIINSVYLKIANEYGSIKKNISNVTIEYTRNLPSIRDMMKYYEDKIKEYEDIITNNNSKNIATGFIRAGNTSYPISATRNSF